MPIDLMLGVLIGSASLGLLLLFDLLVGRSGSGDGVIVRLQGWIDGPGPRRSVAHRPGRGATPFLLRSKLGLIRILPRDAAVRAPWPLRTRALRVGDGVVVDGLLGQERIDESLYRDAGCREAIDAVRITPRRWVLARGVGLVLCATVLSGGVALSRRPLYARLAWGLACPPGAEPAYGERRVPRERAPIELRDLGELRGELAACTVDGKPHGPAVERWRGQYHELGVWRRTGSYLEGRPHGRWVTWAPDGRVAAEGELLAGKRHGVFKSWHDNGRLRSKEDYLEGRLHGLWTSWDRQGAVEDQGMLLEGRRVGSWTIRSGELRCPLPLPWRQQLDHLELSYRDGALEGPVSCVPTRMRAAVVGEVRDNGRAVRVFARDSLAARLGSERLPWRATIAPERVGCRLCSSPDPRNWPQLGLTRVSFGGREDRTAEIEAPQRIHSAGGDGRQGRPEFGGPQRIHSAGGDGRQGRPELERALSDQLWQRAEDLLRCQHRAPDAQEPLVEERTLALRLEGTGRLTPIAIEHTERPWPARVFACLRDAIQRWPGLNPALLERDRAAGIDAYLSLSLAVHRDRRRD